MNQVQVLDQYLTDNTALYNGDCIEVLKGIPANSIDYSIFSPPFASLYTYSNLDRDIGNCKNEDDFSVHFKFLTEELFRVIKPGRLVSFHCMDLPMFKYKDGAIGLKDFPGQLIKAFEDSGFIFHSRVTIWKDPLIAATRTHAIGLLHKQIVKDSSLCRQGIADYLITMRKPGDNPEPIEHPEGFSDYIGTDTIPEGTVYSHQVWRKYASPVWMDINQTNTLAVKGTKDPEDERHICPLQLDVIERGINLWSNPGDIVLDPFMGIGSTPYCAVKMKRHSIGIELKSSYFDVAKKNIDLIESENKEKKEQVSFFSVLGEKNAE